MQDALKQWWSLAALGTLATLGLVGTSVGWAIVGAIALGLTRLFHLVAIKNRYPRVPTTLKIIALYLEQMAVSSLAAGCAWGAGSVVGLIFQA